MQFASKKVVLVMIFTIVLSLNITYWIGEGQKEQYEKDFELFSYAKELIWNQEANKAIPLLNDLNSRYQNDEYILTYLAFAQTFIREYDIALYNYQRSLEINPNLQLQPDFNLKYSRALILNNEYEKAELLLEKISKYKKDKRFSKEYNALLSFIDKNNK